MPPITAEQKHLLNRYAGDVAAKVQLGTLIENAETITASEVPLTDGSILVGNASNVAAAQAVSGDATITNGGVLTIANLAVTTAKLDNLSVTSGKLGADAVSDATKIADDAVSLEHLDSGIEPSHVAKFGGTFTTVGGDTAETIPVVGALGTDVVVVTVKTAGAVPVSIVASAAGVDSIAVTTSADPSNDHVLQYLVFRASA